MTSVLERPRRELYVLAVAGSLHVPVSGRLAKTVEALLDDGRRNIVLDLTGVPSIDAGGIGELVRLYNLTTSCNGTLRIRHANSGVRETLLRVGLYRLLSEGPEARQSIAVSAPCA